MRDYTNSEIAALIDEWIHSERDRKLLKRRLIDGICFEPLAEEFDMSVRQIKAIIYRSQEKIFKHLLWSCFNIPFREKQMLPHLLFSCLKSARKMHLQFIFNQ